jgi:hypothetical protein
MSAADDKKPVVTEQTLKKYAVRSISIKKTLCLSMVLTIGTAVLVSFAGEVDPEQARKTVKPVAPKSVDPEQARKAKPAKKTPEAVDPEQARKTKKPDA